MFRLFLLITVCCLVALPAHAVVSGNGSKSKLQIQMEMRADSRTQFERNMILKQLNEANPDFHNLQDQIRHRENPNLSGALPVPNDVEGQDLADQIRELDRQQQLADLRTAIARKQHNIEITNRYRQFIRNGSNTNSSFYSQDSIIQYGGL